MEKKEELILPPIHPANNPQLLEYFIKASQHLKHHK